MSWREAKMRVQKHCKHCEGTGRIVHGQQCQWCDGKGWIYGHEEQKVLIDLKDEEWAGETS